MRTGTLARLGKRMGEDRQHGDAVPEYEQFFALGVDGMFSDNPDTEVEGRGDFEQ